MRSAFSNKHIEEIEGTETIGKPHSNKKRNQRLLGLLFLACCVGIVAVVIWMKVSGVLDDDDEDKEVNNKLTGNYLFSSVYTLYYAYLIPH